MTFNLDNALHGVQAAREALRVQGRNYNSLEHTTDLEACDGLLNEVEQKIVIMENEK